MSAQANYRSGAQSAQRPPRLRTLKHDQHLDMQAALKPFVDNSTSKTINVPEDCPFSEFPRIYDLAYDIGLKGCTTFRLHPMTGAVLSAAEERTVRAGARSGLRLQRRRLLLICRKAW